MVISLNTTTTAQCEGSRWMPLGNGEREIERGRGGIRNWGRGSGQGEASFKGTQNLWVSLASSYRNSVQGNHHHKAVWSGHNLFQSQCPLLFRSSSLPFFLAIFKLALLSASWAGIKQAFCFSFSFTFSFLVFPFFSWGSASYLCLLALRKFLLQIQSVFK